MLSEINHMGGEKQEEINETKDELGLKTVS